MHAESCRIQSVSWRYKQNALLLLKEQGILHSGILLPFGPDRI